nr:hypothetical protein GCM10025699_07970 [Microbacterium flavescens]
MRWEKEMTRGWRTGVGRSAGPDAVGRVAVEVTGGSDSMSGERREAVEEECTRAG